MIDLETLDLEQVTHDVLYELRNAARPAIIYRQELAGLTEFCARWWVPLYPCHPTMLSDRDYILALGTQCWITIGKAKFVIVHTKQEYLEQERYPQGEFPMRIYRAVQAEPQRFLDMLLRHAHSHFAGGEY